MMYHLKHGENIGGIKLNQAYTNDGKDYLHAGGITMYTDQWKITVDDDPIYLTYLEYQLLQELIKARGNVLTREILLERVWGYMNACVLETRTVDVHIGRLRKKLGKQRGSVITVRNVGYRMDFYPEWIRDG